jgi:Fe-Mn family superoxide dismutase
VKPPRPLEQKQFGDLPSVTVDELKAMLDSGTPVQIIDTRPRHSSSRAPDIMEGVVWRDPDRVDEWMGGIRP